MVEVNFFISPPYLTAGLTRSAKKDGVTQLSEIG